MIELKILKGMLHGLDKSCTSLSRVLCGKKGPDEGLYFRMQIN